MFSKKELARYSRHLILPEIGLEGQERLKKAKVLVVGCGGLGCPLLMYLTAAGVGHIGLIDDDVVDASNLQRQVLYTVDDIGLAKVDCAKRRLKALNPHVEFTTYKTRLTSENALKIFEAFDLVADGTDNFPTRYLVNDACVLSGKVNVYASIFRFEGQASVFNLLEKDGDRGPNYRDIFPSPPPPGMVPSCSESGVFGVLPGIMGSIQANEVIKLITGVGEPLSGKLFLFDSLDFTSRIMKLKKNPLTVISELVDYERFCGLKHAEQNKEPFEISVQELSKWKNEEKQFQLIDVRESYERNIVDISGELIPLGMLENSLEKIDPKLPIVIYCRSGKRSLHALEILKKAGHKNLFSLKGGILAWIEEINPSLPKY